MTNPGTDAPTYSTGEATDQAVMLLIRKLRRLAPGALNQATDLLPEGAREALAAAEQRGDQVRFADEANGVEALSRPWPTRFADLDD